jgi:catechol 2,3-dioxygenase-like lactoylglutathione lyase family enzyme
LLPQRTTNATAEPGRNEEVPMKIKLSSVMVDDQDKALKFYTEVLGFIKEKDIPLGEFKWLTVVSPEGPADIELLLEPNSNPAAKTFQKALFDQGIPLTAFAVDDIQQEYERLKELGVAFRGEPVKMGEATVVAFEDTCGNLIQLYEVQS